MEAMAIGTEESVQDDQIRSRIGQVRHLGELLSDWGIPIMQPGGRPCGLSQYEVLLRAPGAGPVSPAGARLLPGAMTSEPTPIRGCQSFRAAGATSYNNALFLS
jgi:hypothetical protein